MAYTDPDVATFKAYFNRDFPYGNADLTTVQDADITKALNQQSNNINQCLFATQAIYTQGSLLLSAHYLVLNLRASSQGIAGKFEWTVNSKGVGGVSAGFAIPERILENPEFAILASTMYGTQYLYMVLPVLTGQMMAVPGGTIGVQEGFLFTGIWGSVGPWQG